MKFFIPTFLFFILLPTSFLLSQENSISKFNDGEKLFKSKKYRSAVKAWEEAYSLCSQNNCQKNEVNILGSLVTVNYEYLGDKVSAKYWANVLYEKDPKNKWLKEKYYHLLKEENKNNFPDEKKSSWLIGFFLALIVFVFRFFLKKPA